LQARVSKNKLGKYIEKVFPTIFLSFSFSRPNEGTLTFQRIVSRNILEREKFIAKHYTPQQNLKKCTAQKWDCYY
jgi:hypothetical protein